ncbi:MAG: AMP-binding protein, partial [bacterium]|nr:AMP-binding protein [bacterium]
NAQYPITNNYLYRTGDQARYLDDGNIEYLGRIDEQIKIRGFRIELGEIENSLTQHKTVREAAVITRENTTGDKTLLAFLVPETPEPGETGTPTSTITITEIEEYLSLTLPDYMIPSHYITIEKLPLTPNGKIDRKALAKIQISDHEIQDEYHPPGNDIEKKLVEMWARILNLAETGIGVHHSFFKLGGHSLKATALVSHIHKTFKIRIPLPNIFKTP